MSREALKKFATLNNLTFVLASIQVVWLVWFFYTGLGGALELVARVMSIALALQILFMYQQDYLYKWLPPLANHLLVALYLGICAIALVYFHYEFERIAIYSQGSFTQNDYIVGLLVFLLVMELSRLAHPILFWTNVFMVVYTLWGFLSPIDFFWHPGTSFKRIVTSSTVELSTGIYGIYGQLALTLIAAFLLLAGVANGFDAQRAMINVVRTIAGGRGSSSANGGDRIERHRHDQRQRLGQCGGGRHHHDPADDALRCARHLCRGGGNVGIDGRPDHAADDGGRRLPDVGIPRRALLGCRAARVCACDRVLRFDRHGRVYLLCVRLLPRDAIDRPIVPLYEKLKTAVFFLSVLYLIYLMGFVGKGELLAALYTAILMLGSLIALHLYFRYVRKDPVVGDETLMGSIKRAIETHAEMTSYLTLLLATLGIMIGLFTVTGFINRMGAILIDLGAWNPIAMILMAWVFGWLAGAGPAADRDLHHRRGGHRAADEAAGDRPMGRAFLRVPAVGVGRAVAADLADGGRLRPHCQRLVPEDHVRSAQDLRADHAHDVRDLHALQHGDDSRLDAGRRTRAWC